jgi:predicted DCC family thiol-disulfide oxidoreductase YuxK
VVVLLDDGGTHERSEAILRIAEGLGGAWRILGRLTRLVPRAARDLVYDAVARRRYRWFGRESECRLPRRDGDDRFLP